MTNLTFRKMVYGNGDKNDPKLRHPSLIAIYQGKSEIGCNNRRVCL